MILDRIGMWSKTLRDGFFSKYYSLLLIILAPSALFVPMLVRGEALFWGTPLLQFVPWRKFALEVLSRGFLPLWNPLLGLGAPLIANYQSALFYPPNGILFVVGPAWGHGLLVLLHLIWAGLGMRLLTRELGLETFAQTVAALSFSLSGYMIARAGFLSINATAAWLPWLIFMGERLARQHAYAIVNRRNFRSILTLGILMAFQWLAGHAQVSWYSLLLMIAWIGWRGFYFGKIRGLLRTSVAFSISGIFGFLLSSIQLLPVLEFLLNSHRATDLDLQFALNYSFWPWRLLGLIAPNLFGSPATGNFWGYGNFWEDAIYVGVFPLVAGTLYFTRTIWRRGQGSLARFLSMISLISFLFALGKNTPVFTFLFENVPTFDMFQAPTRWSILLVFSLSLFAGLGVDALMRGELINLFWVRLGTVGALTITIVSVGSFFFLPDIKETFIPSIAMFGLWLSLTGILAWRRRIQPGIYWPFLICVLVSVDLIWAGSGLNPSVSLDLYQAPSELLTRVTTDHRLYMDSELEQVLKFEESHRFDTFNPDLDWGVVRDVGVPNTTMLDGVASINNFDPLLADWYADWFAGMETVSGQQRFSWLRFVDVGWVARWDSRQIEEVYYQDLPGPRRAHLVGEVRWVEDLEQAYEMSFDGQFDPFSTVILQREGEIISRNWGAEGQITFLAQTNPNIVQIVVSSPSDTVLVLSDLWYPGWNGYLDGNEVDLYRADYALRAVLVPPGSHTVEFRYRPLSFTLGASLTLLSLISMGFVLWKIRRS